MKAVKTFILLPNCNLSWENKSKDSYINAQDQFQNICGFINLLHFWNQVVGISQTFVQILFVIMGKSQSNTNIEKQLEQSYKYIRRYSNGCYGELTVIEKKSNRKLYALKEFVTQSDAIEKRLSDRKLKQHPGLIRLMEYWIKEQTSLCSNLKQVYILLDYEEHTLEDELLQRQLEDKQWTQAEIYSILYSLVSVLLFLSENGVTHNNISPKTILLTKKGSARILEPQLVSLYTSKSQYVVHVGQFSPFQAPEVLQLSQSQLSGSTLRNINFSKASIFSIGVLILAMHFLNENLEEELIIGGEYDFAHLKKLTYIACETLDQLSTLLPRMLKKEPEKRPTFSELHQALSSRMQKENAGLNNISFKELKNTRLTIDTKAIIEAKVLPSKKLF